MQKKAEQQPFTLSLTSNLQKLQTSKVLGTMFKTIKKKKNKKKRKNEYDTPRDQVCKKKIKVAIDDGLERRHLSRVYECSNCFKDYI